MNCFDKLHDSYRHLCLTKFLEELQTALVQELTDVYRGLACHKEAVIGDAVRDKCLRQAEEHFTAATRLHQCTERVLRPITRTAWDSIASVFSPYDADHKFESKPAMKNATEQGALTSRNEAGCLKNYKCIVYRRYAEQNNCRHNVHTSAM